MSQRRHFVPKRNTNAVVAASLSAQPSTAVSKKRTLAQTMTIDDDGYGDRLTNNNETQPNVKKAPSQTDFKEADFAALTEHFSDLNLSPK